MLHIKQLQKTVTRLEQSDIDLLRKHFSKLWDHYHSETSYYRTLYHNGRMKKEEYDQVAIPKLRNIRNELLRTAKLLGRV